MRLFATLVIAAGLQQSHALRSSGNGVVNEQEALDSMLRVAPKRVAVIGAGAGGSSAAYHLSKNTRAAGVPVEIDVFERSSYIGGRSTTVNAWGDPHVPIELGASIFVEVNHILYDAVKTFNLPVDDSDSRLPEGTPELGVWNGKEFVLITSGGDGWWEKAKLLWKYGLAPLRTNALMRSTVDKFLKMYEGPLFPFTSLSQAVEEVGLTKVTGVTGEQFLKANGIGDAFAKEVIQASTRVNYAQNLALIHGLETMVCMATNGAVSVKGGNWQIFANMVNASATAHLDTTISKVSKQIDGTYSLTTATGKTSTFDTVILAAPLQFSDLVIDPAPQHVPDQIPYVKLHVTLFATPHKLHPSAFGLKPEEIVPSFVLTTLPPNENPGSNPGGVGTAGFFSISIVAAGLNPHSTQKKERPEWIYKIFSPQPVDSAFLSKVLGVKVSDEEAEQGSTDGAVTWIYRKAWHSYPYEYPRVTFDEIKLDDGLFYTSAIESFISTMETSALMGKNVARLVVDEWMAGGRQGRGAEDGEMTLQRTEGEAFQGMGKEAQKPLKAKL